MKKTRKIISGIISLTMALGAVQAFVSTGALADEEDVIYKDIYNVDYEDPDKIPSVTNFDGSTVVLHERRTDETGNHYYYINDGFATSHGADWYNVGYVLETPLASGKYKISFDFNIESANSYSSIGLGNASNISSNPYGQFKLVGYNATTEKLKAGGSDLTGDLDCVIGNWYTFNADIDMDLKTFAITITDGTDSSSASGSFSQGWAFDAIHFGAAIIANIDNINIKKAEIVEDPNKPIFAADFDETNAAFVSFQTNGAKPAATVMGDTDKYVYIDDTNGWTYGGYIFGDSMTEGEYELSFDYSIHTGGYKGYGSVYLTDDNILSNNSQYKEFRLIDWNNGSVYVNTVLPSGNLEYALDHWYTYQMSIDRSNKTYTVTITDKEDASKKATVSGTNLPDKDFNRLMFGTGVIMSVDNILVTKVYKAPEIVSIDYLDKADNYQTELNTATKKIKITFSDKMDPETLSEAVAVRAFGGADLDISGALSEDELSYYITINSDIAEDTTYMIEILQSAASKFGFELESDFMTVARATNGNILLDIDYDNIKPDIELYDTNTSPVTYPEEDGNKYITADISYVNAGYSFRTPIIIDENASYKVSFDFKDYTYQAGYIMALTQKNCLAGSGDLSTYDQFGLLRLDGANFLVAGSNVPGLTYEAGKWYSYELNFNRVTRVYDVTITDKADPENKAHLVSVLPNSAYGAGMYEYRTYNALKFYNKGSISVDNIKVEKTEGVFDIYIDSVKKADADVENISDLSGNISVKVVADNTTGSAVSATVIAAYYDEAGKCIAVSSAPADILENAAGNSVTIELSCPENAASAKVMLWDSLGGAKAYCGAYNI